jgi:uncharacterized membrane protein
METAELHWDFNSIKVFFSILATFTLSCLAWIFFRAKTISDALLYIKRMVTDLRFSEQYFSIERYSNELLLLLLLFVIVEWNSRTKIEPISGKYSWLKLGLCLSAIVALGVFSDYKEFIYFQF